MQIFVLKIVQNHKLDAQFRGKSYLPICNHQSKNFVSSRNLLPKDLYSWILPKKMEMNVTFVFRSLYGNESATGVCLVRKYFHLRIQESFSTSSGWVTPFSNQGFQLLAYLKPHRTDVWEPLFRYFCILNIKKHIKRFLGHKSWSP